MRAILERDARRLNLMAACEEDLTIIKQEIKDNGTSIINTVFALRARLAFLVSLLYEKK